MQKTIQAIYKQIVAKHKLIERPQQSDMLNDCYKAMSEGKIALLESATGEDGVIRPFADETRIFITPGYRFRAIDGLMTNFHLPKSTLIMMVSAFAGREFVLDAYRRAVEEKYRFFSFGDAMLIL